MSGGRTVRNPLLGLVLYIQQSTPPINVIGNKQTQTIAEDDIDNEWGIRDLREVFVRNCHSGMICSRDLLACCVSLLCEMAIFAYPRILAAQRACSDSCHLATCYAMPRTTYRERFQVILLKYYGEWGITSVFGHYYIRSRRIIVVRGMAVCEVTTIGQAMSPCLSESDINHLNHIAILHNKQP